MPRFNSQKISKIQFKRSDAEKKDTLKNNSPSRSTDKDIKSSKSAIPTSVDPNRLKQSNLPQKVLSSNLEEMRIFDKIPSKSTIGVFAGKSPLKFPRAVGGRIPRHDASFLGQKESNSHMVSEVLMQKERVASCFLSVEIGKGRMIRRKATQLRGQGVLWHSKETRRLSYVKRLKLFQALSNKPMSFLDLHVRFGVSKQTIRRLVKNGFLMEVWGSNAIGVKFKLTNKSKDRLKELEAVAKSDPRITERSLIRLKQRI